MNILDKKFRNNKLNKKELIEFRNIVNSSDDSQLEKLLQKSWDSEDFDSNQITSSQVNILHKKIEKEISKSRHSIKIKHIFNIAAAIILPILLVSTIYLYNKQSNIIYNETSISTSKGEKVTVTLPDGSKITLNSESKLTYNIKDFNNNQREISFNGEGYFQIKKNPSAPFNIKANEITVKVLGTTFNFNSYSTNNVSNLALEEGIVSFEIPKRNKQIIITANQKINFNHVNGGIKVENVNNITDYSAWKQNELIFRDIPLTNVLDKLESIFNKKIIIINYDSKILSDSFTGTLSSENPHDALRILKENYKFKIIYKNDHIILDFSNKKK